MLRRERDSRDRTLAFLFCFAAIVIFSLRLSCSSFLPWPFVESSESSEHPSSHLYPNGRQDSISPTIVTPYGVFTNPNSVHWSFNLAAEVQRFNLSQVVLTWVDQGHVGEYARRRGWKTEIQGNAEIQL